MRLVVIAAAFLFFMQCSPHMNPAYSPLEGKDSFDKEGYRGCRGLMPENSIPAFIKAVDLGVNTLEMDVVISKDNKVVVSHDPYFNYEITTKPNGDTVTQAEEEGLRLYSMDYEEIRKYDAGLKPHLRFPSQQKLPAYKPLLAEVIDSVAAYTALTKHRNVYYNIEIKSTPGGDDIFNPKPGVFVDLLMNVIKEKNIERWVIIQSFDIRTLQYLHKTYPSIKTSLLVENNKPFAIQLKELGFIPTVYSPEYRLVTPLLVQQCHDAGIKIIPWTVNDKAQIRKLKTLGVDGIISDYPDLL